jgi:hypothetical protein
VSAVVFGGDRRGQAGSNSSRRRSGKLKRFSFFIFPEDSWLQSLPATTRPAVTRYRQWAGTGFRRILFRVVRRRDGLCVSERAIGSPRVWPCFLWRPIALPTRTAWLTSAAELPRQHRNVPAGQFGFLLFDIHSVATSREKISAKMAAPVRADVRMSRRERP